jgi:hypothetical protein
VPQGAVREAADLRQPAAAVAEEMEPHTGWHLGTFPRPSRTWRSFNARVHLIREDERIAAGSVTLTDAPSVSRPVRAAAIDKPDINVISP